MESDIYEQKHEQKPVDASPRSRFLNRAFTYFAVFATGASCAALVTMHYAIGVIDHYKAIIDALQQQQAIEIPVVRDTNGDGVDDIIVRTSRSLNIFDGRIVAEASASLEDATKE